MEVSRVDYAEGGLLSEKRVYLRLLRERLAKRMVRRSFGKQSFFLLPHHVILRRWPASGTLLSAFVFFCGVFSFS